MQSLFRTFIAAVFLTAAPVAFATPHSHDANDLWVAFDELGWGVNIFHQGNTLFASLFVYGPDGKARWYTASNLVGDDGGQLRDHPNIYSGPLVESTGPAVGGPFDPSRVTRRQVGTMTVELATEKAGGTGPLRNYAWIYYSVDGVQVQKKAYPFAFVATGLSGSYTGFLGSPTGSREAMNANVSLNNGSFAMSTTNNVGTSCTYSGPQNANGSLFHVEGSFSCTDGRSGNFTLSNVDVTRHGFTAGLASGTSMTDIAMQRTSSTIRGDGYNTDLWFPPNESGWGLNIIEQGDTLFGTLFVYDAQGQPRWYSASNLNYEQCAPPDAASDCAGIYRGALVESTGPYFGTAFNPAAVQRRVVGSMSLRVTRFGENSASLEYTIDGVTVSKDVRRYAFRENSLSGGYAGHMLATPGNGDGGVPLGQMTFDITDSGGTLTMVARDTPRGTCTLRGQRSQFGRQVAAAGPYECVSGVVGQLQLTDLYPTWSGFTGAFAIDGKPVGRIEGVRTAR